MSQVLRKIVHLDMDAFYAAVEQRDDPTLRGRPVVVGGPPNSRGVVCTASYEARKFGVRSAMPCSQAARLCPQAVFVAPRFDAYKDVSRSLHAIFSDYTDRIEPLSLDEAYLDVTENKRAWEHATPIAQEIRTRIRSELHLTGSAGVSYCKFLAKVASDLRKPDGLTVIRPRTGQGRDRWTARGELLRGGAGHGKAIEGGGHRHGGGSPRIRRGGLVACAGSDGGVFCGGCPMAGTIARWNRIASANRWARRTPSRATRPASGCSRIFCTD
jgi:hypothetical protein